VLTSLSCQPWLSRSKRIQKNPIANRSPEIHGPDLPRKKTPNVDRIFQALSVSGQRLLSVSRTDPEDSARNVPRSVGAPPAPGAGTFPAECSEVRHRSECVHVTERCPRIQAPLGCQGTHRPTVVEVVNAGGRGRRGRKGRGEREGQGKGAGSGSASISGSSSRKRKARKAWSKPVWRAPASDLPHRRRLQPGRVRKPIRRRSRQAQPASRRWHVRNRSLPRT
jgi:hypothetical protein